MLRLTKSSMPTHCWGCRPPATRTRSVGRGSRSAKRVRLREQCSYRRQQTAAKINGTAVYGIDVRPPGVKIATLAQSPAFGGRLKSVDDTAAKSINGVRQIVLLDDAVAVVADHMGAAKKGIAALKIEWDTGPHAKLDTDAIAGELEKATLHAGAVAQNIGNVEASMAGAVTKVEVGYQVPFLA